MKSLLRFVIVGGCSTTIDFCIYFILSSWIDLNISKGISMVIACIVSFFINKNWTFENKEEISYKHILKYIISQGINILVNVSVNYLVFMQFGSKIVSFICATGSGMLCNFLLQKTFVFKMKNSDSSH